jgi:hypothetical protein
VCANVQMSRCSLSHANKENLFKIFNNAHHNMAYLTAQEGKLLWDDFYATV